MSVSHGRRIHSSVYRVMSARQKAVARDRRNTSERHVSKRLCLGRCWVSAFGEAARDRWNAPVSKRTLHEHPQASFTIRRHTCYSGHKWPTEAASACTRERRLLRSDNLPTCRPHVVQNGNLHCHSERLLDFASAAEARVPAVRTRDCCRCTAATKAPAAAYETFS